MINVIFLSPLQQPDLSPRIWLGITQHLLPETKPGLSLRRKFKRVTLSEAKGL